MDKSANLNQILYFDRSFVVTITVQIRYFNLKNIAAKVLILEPKTSNISEKRNLSANF